jgi:pSer/pThr/pTyr-binding forkhead associated (FHA) protein
MSARVILTVTEGDVPVKEYLFSTRTLCTVGRSDDCQLRLPNDEAHLTVSRRHCALDIAPPAVWVRDLGSRNGTYVNGERLPPEEAGCAGWPEYELHDGDEVRVGRTTLRIGVFVPLPAGEATAEPARPVAEDDPRACAPDSHHWLTPLRSPPESVGCSPSGRGQQGDGDS